MTEDTQLMKTAEEELGTARYLLEGDRFNASISRAYYAIFYGAKALLKGKNSSPKTHQGVSSELGRLYRKELSSETTRKYSKIQTWREEADYSTGKNFTEKEAEEAIDFADSFLKKVKRIKNDS